MPAPTLIFFFEDHVDILREPADLEFLPHMYGELFVSSALPELHHFFPLSLIDLPCNVPQLKLFADTKPLFSHDETIFAEGAHSALRALVDAS
jgi:hypothetical protein